jgi:hypothetical protein
MVFNATYNNSSVISWRWIWYLRGWFSVLPFLRLRYNFIKKTTRIYTSQSISIKTQISNLVRTTRFWNNLQHVRLKPTNWKAKLDVCRIFFLPLLSLLIHFTLCIAKKTNKQTKTKNKQKIKTKRLKY